MKISVYTGNYIGVEANVFYEIAKDVSWNTKEKYSRCHNYLGQKYFFFINAFFWEQKKFARFRVKVDPYRLKLNQTLWVKKL